MKFYWTEDSIPELKGVPKIKRKHAINYALNKSSSFLLFLGLMIPSSILQFALDYILEAINLPEYIGFGIAFGLLCYFYTQISLNRARPYLKEYLDMCRDQD